MSDHFAVVVLDPVKSPLFGRLRKVRLARLAELGLDAVDGHQVCGFIKAEDIRALLRHFGVEHVRARPGSVMTSSGLFTAMAYRASRNADAVYIL